MYFLKSIHLNFIRKSTVKKLYEIFKKLVLKKVKGCFLPSSICDAGKFLPKFEISNYFVLLLKHFLLIVTNQ